MFAYFTILLATKALLIKSIFFLPQVILILIFDEEYDISRPLLALTILEICNLSLN
jgi:hypothetical protein